MKTSKSKKRRYFSQMKKTTMTICMAFGFSGMNLIVSGIIWGEQLGNLEIMIGVILLLMVPLSIWDKRPDMNSLPYAIAILFVAIVIGVLLSYLQSWLWLIALIIEGIIGGLFLAHQA